MALIPSKDNSGRRPTPDARRAITSYRPADLPIPPADDGGLGAAGDALFKIGAELRAREEKAKRISETTKANEIALRVEEDAMKDYEERRRNEASSDDFAANIRKSMDERIENALKDTKLSEEVSARLQTRLQRTRLSFYGDALRAQYKAAGEKANDVYMAQVNQLSEQARTNPASVAEILSRADEVLDGYKDALGENRARDGRNNARNNIVLAGINGALEAKNVAAARQVLKTPGIGADIDARTMNVLNARIDAAEDRFKREGERDRRLQFARMRDEMNSHIASIQATGQGVPGLERKVSALGDADDIEAFLDAQERAFETHKSVSRMSVATPGDIASVLKEKEPVPGSKTYAEDAQRYEVLRKHAVSLMTHRAKDPGAYAESTFDDVRMAFDSAGSDPGALQSAVDLSLKTQADLGIPKSQQRPVSNSQAKALTMQVMEKPVTERAAEIRRMSEQFGAFWPSVLRQMSSKDGGGLDIKTGVLAMFDGSPSLQQRVASSIEYRDENEKSLPRADVNDVKREVQKEFADFRRPFEAGSAASVPIANAYEDVLRGVALTHIKEGQRPAEAAKNAARMFYDSYHVSETYIAPKELPDRTPVNPNKIDAYAQMVRDNADIYDIIPIKGGALEEINERTMKSLMKNNAVFINNESGDGVYMAVTTQDGTALPVLIEDGDEVKRLEFSFQEIMNSSVLPLATTPGSQRRQAANSAVLKSMTRDELQKVAGNKDNPLAKQAAEMLKNAPR